MDELRTYKLGSLFDGSGGFPLAGALCGVEPVWASEVEPYPIAVTRSRFPKMRHLGDISKINGAEIEPVDIITFGSPCQDLSVAGKQAGLKHTDNGDEETTRSGLFMEAVRIIKEMRKATNGNYPRFALWENVPGAFSSNRGEDFRIVLEELVKIVEPSAFMPPVPKNGWNYADSYTGDGWSLAYRVLDAQYWGVPQRRRRIYLVADFRGERAREVLFERNGLRGYFEEGRTPWQGAPTNAQGSTGANDREGEGNNEGDRDRGLDAVIALDRESYNSGYNFDRAPGIRTDGISHTVIAQGPTAVCYMFENHSQDTRYTGPLKVSQTVSATYGMGGNNQPFVVMEPKPVYCLQGSMIGRAEKNGPQGSGVNKDIAFTQNATDRPAVVYAEPPRYIVRRLTPTECARLQGFADCWGYIEPKDTLTDEEISFWLEVRNTHAAINGKKVQDYTAKQMLTWYNKLYTDSAEYKMWGNGIALPTALYCIQGVTDALKAEEDAWML